MSHVTNFKGQNMFCPKNNRQKRAPGQSIHLRGDAACQLPSLVIDSLSYKYCPDVEGLIMELSTKHVHCQQK